MSKIELCDETIKDLDDAIVCLEDFMKATSDRISKLEMELREAKDALACDKREIEKMRLERTALKWFRDTMTGTDLC